MTNFHTAPHAPALDVEVTGLGESVLRFVPLTDAARDWFDENVHAEGWQWLGPALCVDHRLAADLLRGIDAAGLRFHAS
jgi:hypothetical protein